MLDCRQVEAGEGIELEPRRIGQHSLEVGRIILAAGGEANQMFVTLAVDQLDQTQPVAVGDEPHGFGVHRNRALAQHAFGKVFFVKIYSHREGALGRLGTEGKGWRSEEKTSVLQTLIRISYDDF